jgi:hypothetical protein
MARAVRTVTEADVEGLDALFQGLSDDDARGFASATSSSA